MRTVLALILVASVALGAATIARSADRKFGLIEKGSLQPGARVDFTAAELQAWAIDESRIYAPGALRDARLTLTAGGLTASAQIDFLKLHRAATGEDPGWIMKNLFAGERAVTVAVKFQSANGRGRVDVQRVTVSGVPIEGPALRFLIDNWLRPTFPDVKANEWFGLCCRVNRFEVANGKATVYIGR